MTCRILQENGGAITLEDGTGVLILEVCDDHVGAWHLQHVMSHLATDRPDTVSSPNTRGLTRQHVKWNWG